MSSEPSKHTTSSKAITNGVLPVTAAQTAGKPVTKASDTKLKVVIRRLPPGLTEEEFVQILGEEWAVGRGKVDWFSYMPGKESKDPSKPSRPSRAYLHLTHSDNLIILPEVIRKLTFEDACNTWNSSCLLGPPSVEFSPYGHIPSVKHRNDARQGTIDQDPDFMDFLESLANPHPSKDTAAEASTEETKIEAVTTTPLVQFLKEKKANKGKEAATTVKTGKPVAVKAVSKVTKECSSLEDAKKKGRDAKAERLVGKSTKEVIKVLNRESAAKVSTSTATPPPAAPEANPKNPRAAARERGSIAAAARLIQRDLGFSPSNAHRKAKADIAAADVKAAAAAATAAATATATAALPSGEASSTQSTQRSATPTGPRGNATESRSRGRGNRGANADSATSKPSSKDIGKSSQSTASAAPITLLKKPTVETPSQSAATPTSARTPTPAAAKTQPTPTATASTSLSPPSRQRNQPAQPTPPAATKRAFVKHANPSQGITEALLKEALEVYGATSSVEIDKRKGFAYVDFVDVAGLIKAMKANPIKIANGTVQVLERKDRESHAGGGRAAKGGASAAETVVGGNTNGVGRNGGRSGRGGGERGGGGAATGGGGRNRGRNRGAAAASTSTASAGKENPTSLAAKEAASEK